MKMKKNKERKKTKIQRGWDFGNGKFRKKKQGNIWNKNRLKYSSM